MSLTITIPGAVEATIGATAPAVLTIGVGTPGATGPAGPAGPGVPAGGLTAQFLQKTSNTSYATDWVTLPAYLPLAGGTMNVNAAIDFSDTTTGTVSEVGGYGMAVSSASNAALYSNVLFDRVLVANATGATTLKPTGVEFPDLTLQTTAGISAATASATYQTLAGMSSYLTTSAAASTYQTLAGMSSYLTTATAATTYAPIAAGLPTGGTVGQVLTKNSGTNFDASFATLIPGDRYLTTSSTSNTVSNGNKTFTVGTGLSYTPTQNLTIAYDASNHMHGEVLTYNSGTGVLTVDVNNHTGTGTYASWVVNVGGVTPATSVAWGDITGTLGDQTDLATALNAKSPLASPTFTGTVTIPAGASISGFAPLASPSLTGTPLSTTAAADTNTTQIATTAYVIGQASSTTPAATGTAAVGTSLKYARADHVHANPLPPNGTTAQVLSKIDGTSYNVQWVTPSGGGGGGTDYQAYTTPGTFTWTKPAGAKWVEVYLFAGGGGGGSGARFNTSTSRCGGAGGGSGSFLLTSVAASGLGSTETVVVGAGGAGGASITTDTTAGLIGGSGGSTTFSIFTAVGTVGGTGGSGAAVTGVTARTGYIRGTASQSVTGASGAGNNTAGGSAGALLATNSIAPTGGGGGAGGNIGIVPAAGGAAGTKTAPAANQSGTAGVAGGAGGTVLGVLPTSGVSGDGIRGGGTGGGGGAYLGNVAGMAGAAGAAPGGGGGGGSASDNGFASGAGGAGGSGVAYIITYC